MNKLLTGTVTASFGRLHEVTLPGTPAPLECVRRGRRKDVICGDHVTVSITSPSQGVIESVQERRNLLHRSDEHRDKPLAANVDQALVVVAADPSYHDGILTRCLIAAEAAGVHPVIVLNKTDQSEGTARCLDALGYYEQLGYPLVAVSALHDVSALAAVLKGRVSLLVGQSGMGKSSLINALVPGATARTGLLSTALDSGRHTTTLTRWYPLDAGGALIDSPGMQTFGLAHLQVSEYHFREFAPLAGQCQFSDCRHWKEPGCALKAWVAGHPQRERRLQYLCELQQNQRKTRH